MQPPRLKLGLTLVSLLAIALSDLPILSAAQHVVPKHAAVKSVGNGKATAKAAPKPSGKSSSKSAPKAQARGSAKTPSTKSAGPSKGSPKGSLRASPKGSRRGSSPAALKTAPKRSQKTVYRQQQPEPERIREIQQALNDRGYPLQVSGAWDGSTVDALKKFQSDQQIENLSGKGKLDSMTLIALGLGPKREPPSDLTEVPRQTPEGKLP